MIDMKMSTQINDGFTQTTAKIARNIVDSNNSYLGLPYGRIEWVIYKREVIYDKRKNLYMQF